MLALSPVATIVPPDVAALSRGSITAIGVVALLALIGLSGFFSSSELALFSLSTHRVEALANEGVQGAATVQDLLANPHRLLITILVGNNLANIAMSSLATGLLGLYLSRGQSVLAATFGITGIVLLFGESVPKSYAIENTESWALRVARPLALSEHALYPLVVVFDYLTRAVNRLVGSRSAIESSVVTRDEIVDMIETGEREGAIDADEREMLRRILRFRDTIAKEVMTPRLDATAVTADANIDDALATCAESGHERLPVYRGSLDEIVGVVTWDVLVRAQRSGEGESATVGDYADSVPHVPESKNVAELLEELRRDRVKMAIIVDEFGTTEGLVTTEDLVEAIVGDLPDDDEESPLEVVDDDTVRVRGEVNIEEVNDTLDIELPEGEEFETIAGFVFNRAGRLVEVGEAFTYGDVELRVESTDHTRIESVLVRRRSERTSTGEKTEIAGKK